jgi:hypothetical protein
MVADKEGFLGVVQFIHPGNEHRVDKSGWTPWNLKIHCRKYMLAKGQYLDSDSRIFGSEVLFWGEWEGPSRAVFSWDSTSKTLPRNLVVPHYPGSARPVKGLQNTDPYVFGDFFKYTLCKQVKKNGDHTFLTRLLPGTLVLFGSKVTGRFALDCAMVVGTKNRLHSSNNWNENMSDCSPVYRSMTLEPMYWDTHTDPNATFNYYEGASYNSQLNGTFSFTPCIPATNVPQTFARPVINLEGVVNHALPMGQKQTKMSLSSIKECWNSVVQQVQNNDLSLAVALEEPALSEVPDHVWPH